MFPSPRRLKILRASLVVMTWRRPTPSAFCWGTQTRESLARMRSW